MAEVCSADLNVSNSQAAKFELARVIRRQWHGTALYKQRYISFCTFFHRISAILDALQHKKRRVEKGIADDITPPVTAPERNNPRPSPQICCL